MLYAVAYPELVSGSGGVSKSRTFRWLVKVGASRVSPPDLRKSWTWGGISGQPRNPPGYATDMRYV